MDAAGIFFGMPTSSQIETQKLIMTAWPSLRLDLLVLITSFNLFLFIYVFASGLFNLPFILYVLLSCFLCGWLAPPLTLPVSP